MKNNRNNKIDVTKGKKQEASQRPWEEKEFASFEFLNEAR